MAEGLKAEKGFSAQWRSEEQLDRLLPAIAAERLPERLAKDLEAIFSLAG